MKRAVHQEADEIIGREREGRVIAGVVAETLLIDLREIEVGRKVREAQGTHIKNSEVAEPGVALDARVTTRVRAPGSRN